MLGNLGPMELMIILVIVLVLFGARRVPEIGASIGKGIREFKKNISDVDRMVTIRVEELASAPALKPSSTARSEENRNTAIATLKTVRNVRRLLRRALFSISPMNFMIAPVR